ncbi:hypothetical protein EDD21DRAFT_421445 [Dissophora ornata]|nr:hypothetical protein EDD21DRAFT_421445 [Dissophora ornata]
MTTTSPPSVHSNSATASSSPQSDGAPVLPQSRLGPVAGSLPSTATSTVGTTEDYSLWRFVEDVDQVAEQLGWRKHSVIGHSMGGAVASLYAAVFQSR